jgi:hypothetical protein
MDNYIGLLIQIPLVGIFVLFSLRLIAIFMESLDKRDASWQVFLEQQRKQSNEAIQFMAARFADEIRVLGKEVSEMKGKIE